MVNIKLTNELAKELNFTEKHLVSNALNFLISKEVIEPNCMTTLISNLSVLNDTKDLMNKLLVDETNSSKVINEWVKTIPPLTTVNELHKYIKTINNVTADDKIEDYIMMMKTVSNLFSIIINSYGHGSFRGTYIDEDDNELVIFSSYPTSLQILAFHLCEVCKVKTNQNDKFFGKLFNMTHSDFKRYERYIGREVYKELLEHADDIRFKEVFNSRNLDAKFLAIMTSVDFTSRNEASYLLVNHKYEEGKQVSSYVNSNYDFYDYLLTSGIDNKLGSEIILSEESMESDILVTHIAVRHTKETILEQRQILAIGEVSMISTEDEYDIFTFKETHITETEVDKHSIHGKITYKGNLHDYVFDIESTRLTSFFATSIPKMLAFSRYLSVSGITGEVMHPIKTKKTLATYCDENSLLAPNGNDKLSDLGIIYQKVKEHFNSSFYVMITNPSETLIKIADKKDKNPIDKITQMDLAIIVNPKETLTSVRKLKIKADKKKEKVKK